MAKKVAPTPKDTVAQSNKLTMARYDLSAVQKKLVAMVFAKVRMEDEDFQEYEFKRQDIARLLGREADNDYAWLKAEATKLLKQVAQLPNPKDPNGWILSTFFSAITYSPKESTVTFKPSPDMRPYFLKLQQEYTLVPLPYVMSLSGKYALRLLELVLQWWTVIDSKGSFTIPVGIDELRAAWGVGQRYKDNRQLKQAVVNRAVLEINAARLGFRIGVETDRSGSRGAVQKFEFVVTRIREEDPVPVDPVTEDDETVEGLSPERRALFDKILEEIHAEGDLFPLAGYSSEFMRDYAQQGEALKRLAERYPLKARRGRSTKRKA
jgi:Protein involved in initiation of plasmid replication